MVVINGDFQQGTIMTILNHIALLVRSVDQAANILAKYGFLIGSKEEWDGEGTAEIYVGNTDWSAKLLLMGPVKVGAYSKAMEKRGPGLHHIAIDVSDLEEYILALAGSGWYLHLKSLESIKKTRTAWLARPGTAMLIEVQERQDFEDTPSLIKRIEIPLSDRERSMVNALALNTILPSQDLQTWFETDRVRISLKDILAVES